MTGDHVVWLNLRDRNGRVHASDSAGSTKCGLKWRRPQPTNKPVTCKRCLASLEREEGS